jgi:hypothetical protein
LALQTLFDLHLELSSGTIVVGSNGGALESMGGLAPPATFPELGNAPVLVHGYVRGSSGELKDIKFGHAWLEGNDFVLDCGSAELRHILVPVDHYYASWRINSEECHRYTIQQAIQHLVASGLINGWHPAPPDVASLHFNTSWDSVDQVNAASSSMRASGESAESMWSRP